MMAMHRTIRFLTPLSLAALAAAGSSSPPRAHELDGSYTYSQYTSHFNKSYSADEYELRSEIFERNFRKILDHNAARADRAGIGGYLMGVNEFTDRETTEVKLGWNKLMHFAWRDQFRKNELLLEEKASVSAERFLGGAKSYSLPFDFEIEPISSFPASVDWTDIVNPAPSQGCGDCWAYAATACIESHLAMATANLMQLSYVNMLECTPNPERCGGDGGCDGATCEEAFNYIADMTANNAGGMYRANDISQGESCSYAEASPVVGIDGWTLLPSNNYTVTMNALAKVGPLAIAVAAGSWQAYESGVLSTSASTVNHAVLLVGYGTDEITGEDYYLIRNSWGSGWGENGYIRIKRGEDDSANCVMDDEPLLGIGCEMDDNGNQVDVQPVQVCGESAVLFDVAYPVGVHMLD